MDSIQSCSGRNAPPTKSWEVLHRPGLTGCVCECVRIVDGCEGALEDDIVCEQAVELRYLI